MTKTTNGIQSFRHRPGNHLRDAIVSMVPLILLVSWPFVAFLANNRDQILRLVDVLFPWASMLVIAIIITLLATRLINGRPLRRIAISIGFLNVVFFSYGGLANLLILADIRLGTIWLASWLFVFVATGFIVWPLSKRPAAFMLTNVVAVTLIAWPALQLMADGATITGSNNPKVFTKRVANAQQTSKNRPNVYWFLLDGYVRKDSLARYFNYDNEPFLTFLEDKGFNIGHKSFSNYDNTTLSLTTTLTSSYRQLPDGGLPDPNDQVSVLSGFNPVVRNFKALGYHYIHAPYAGSAKTQCGGLENRCIRARPSGGIPLNAVQLSILKLTPLFRVLRRVSANAFSYDHIFVEDILVALNAPQPAPFFLFAHILSPHAPPRFTNTCQRLKGITGTVDVGEGYYEPTQFAIDTHCLNQSLEKAVQKIVEEDTSNPIIILQSDHGFKFRIPGEPVFDPETAAEGSEPIRRLANLNAMLLPAACRNSFHSTLSPINTFPLVFSCINGRAPKLKHERYFVRSKSKMGGVTEVHPE
ncbi:MAG: hypothetical protein OSB67_02175 [Alphaproteobacteria bacterium]|nr:hypothetical protein [Alphaproteobacteria bacterium]